MSALARLVPLAAALLLPACATVTGTPTQRIVVQAFDAKGRAVAMRCHVRHGPAEYFGSTPMFDLEIRRSSSDLQIACQRGAETARGTAVSRGSNRMAALLPGGTASLLVDHVTGYSYEYPQRVHLQVGQDLIFDASERVAGRPVAPLQAERP